MPSVPLLISLLSLCQWTMWGKGHPEKTHSKSIALSWMISVGELVTGTTFNAPKENEEVYIFSRVIVSNYTRWQLY